MLRKSLTIRILGALAMPYEGELRRRSEQGRAPRFIRTAKTIIFNRELRPDWPRAGTIYIGEGGGCGSSRFRSCGTTGSGNIAAAFRFWIWRNSSKARADSLA